MDALFRQHFAATSALFLAAVLSACGGGGAAQPANTPPVATALTIADSNNGGARVGDELTATYTFTDADGDPEDGSELQWRRDAAPIPGATSPTYRLTKTDIGSDVTFAVQPRAASGVLTGAPAESSAVAVTARAGTRVPTQSLTSTYTGRTYSIDVLLPEGYSTSAAAYRVIYQLSPNSTFMNNARAIDAEGKDVVLVSFGHVDNDLRFADYTLPGARDFFRFITLELIPFVEAQYRLDPAGRTLSGHSLGGLFTGLALLLDDPQDRHFTSYLISDGTFQRNAWLTQNLERQLAAQTSELSAEVLVVTALRGNWFSNQGYADMLEARGYAGLTLAYTEYDVRHEQVAPLAFADGLDQLVP